MLSTEQLHIYNVIQNNNSLLIESCAGSGKTTLIEYICKNQCHKNILILCYNRMLMNNTFKKVCMLDNVIINTFHSFGLKYYNSNCLTDEGILYIIQNNCQKTKQDMFDLLIVDECQDLTYFYNEFINKIIKDYCLESLQVCLLGDSNQMIYSFKGASCKYMYSRNFNMYKLLKSFRITESMAYFIRNGLNIEIYSDKKGDPVRFIETDNRWYATYKEVNYYLLLGYQHSDIYIITPSTKCKFRDSKIKVLQQLLTYQNIFIEIPDENIDKSHNIYNNKLLINTIHGVKGLENKIVIFTMFDTSFDDILQITSNQCPNELYVALTRATHHLSIITNGNYLHYFNKDVLNTKYITHIYYSFYSHKTLCYIYPLVLTTNNILKCKHGGEINLSLLNEYTESKIYNICFKCIDKQIVYYIHQPIWNNIPLKQIQKLHYKKTNFNVTELLTFVTIDDILYIDKFNKENNIFTIEKNIFAKSNYNIKRFIKQYFHDQDIQIEIHESVNSLIGKIVVYYIELILTNDLQILNNNIVKNHVSKRYFNKICNKSDIIQELVKEIKSDKCCELLTIISIYDEMVHIHYTHRAYLQIKNYKLVNISFLEKVFHNLKKTLIINDTLQFEIQVEQILLKYKIKGSIDLIINDTMIEFKCKHFSSTEDIYQLLIYAYLFNKQLSNYKLINLFTNEEIIIHIHNLHKIYDIICYFICKKN